jgi:hypothetical protein
VLFVRDDLHRAMNQFNRDPEPPKNDDIDNPHTG